MSHKIKNSLKAATDSERQEIELTNSVVVYHKSEEIMTNKFKVGNLVKPIEDLSSYGFPIDEIVPVVGVYGNQNTIRVRNTAGVEETFFVERFELFESTKRITALEETVTKQGEEITELKLIVEQLRKPSTEVAEALAEQAEIIEFEGAQYRKVDREAREGDVVILNERGTEFFFTNKTYLVKDGRIRDEQTNTNGAIYDHGRTPENVDVYELFSMAFDDLEDAPIKKSPNQLRAEIIEKAKGFVDKHLTSSRYGYGVVDNNTTPLTLSAGPVRFKFIVNVEKRTVVALGVLYHLDHGSRYKGIAKCNPSDVFNEHIGKAIALGRALGLDVSEFEGAVQPSEVVEGMISALDDRQLIVTDKTYVFGETCHSKSHFARYGTIINDTNAIYFGGVK